MDPHARKTYYGSRLGFREQPDLSAFSACHTVKLDHNDIRILYRDLLPPVLTRLDVSKNNILTDGLCYEWPNTLEELHLEDNAIRDLFAVSHWPTHLKKLYLDGNPLDECFLVLPSLEVLSCSYSSLRHSNILPPQLKVLDAFYNRIRKLGKLPQTLEHCNLAYNQLASYSIFFHPLPQNLKYLNLAGNRIQTIPENLPDTIETLLLSKNKIVKIPENLPKNLLQLDVSTNRIQKFEPRWKSGQRIQQLLLRDNCITHSIQPILNSGHVVKILYADNWNQEIHIISATLIQRHFKKFQLRKIFRQIIRWKKIFAEFMEIAYHPDFLGRWNVPETWDLWNRT